MRLSAGRCTTALQLSQTLVTSRVLGRYSSQAIGWLALVVRVGLMWGGGEAEAAELALKEPSSCIAMDELAFRVERLLGRPLAAVEAMQISIRVEPTPAGFVAELEVERPSLAERGVRSLRAPSCEALSEALTLAIVVAVGEGDEAPEPPAPRPEPAPARDEIAASVAPPVAEVDADSSGPALAGVAWIIGDTGTLPVPGLGVAFGMGFAWSGVELRALGTWLPEREGPLVAADASSPGASIGLVAGSVLACVPVAVERAVLGVAACLGWEVGQLSGSGTHVSLPYDQRRLWSAARLDVAARWPVPNTPLGLDLSVTATAPLTRDEFYLEELGRVHRPASVGGRFALGLSVAVD